MKQKLLKIWLNIPHYCLMLMLRLRNTKDTDKEKKPQTLSRTKFDRLRNPKVDIFWILLATLTIQGCVTQRACNAKFPLHIENTDSLVILNDTIYRDTTFFIKADTVSETIDLGENWKSKSNLYFPPFENVSVLHHGRATLTTITTPTGIKINCTADSLTLVIDSLYNVIKSSTDFKTKTITQTLTEIKYRMPVWAIVLLCSFGLFSIAKVITSIKH